jgi:hypothetical protein
MANKPYSPQSHPDRRLADELRKIRDALQGYQVAGSYQPLDATLTALASALTAANKIPYATAADTLGELDFKDEDDMSSNSATAVPSQQSVKAYVDASSVIQQVYSVNGAVATTSTTIPLDDTIPQNTEGAQFLSVAITPTNASNLLRVDVVFHAAVNDTAKRLIVALFKDSTANALAASTVFFPDSNVPIQSCFTYWMAAGGTSEITFKVRAGPSAASTVTFNGASGARLLGGVMASSITATEYKV